MVGKSERRYRRPAFVITTTTALVLTLTLLSSGVHAPDYSVNVTQVSLSLNGVLVEAVVDPSSTLTFELAGHTGEEEASLSLVAVNPAGAWVSWYFWSGLHESVFVGTTSEGIVGTQGENAWQHSSCEQKLILSVTGTVDFANLESDGATTIAHLSYASTGGQLRPLLAISVHLEDGSGDFDVIIEAEAVLSQLETEISGSSLPEEQLAYFRSELTAAQLYFERHEFEKSFEKGQAALEEFRARQESYWSISARLLRALVSSWYILVVPGVVVVGAAIWRLRGKSNGMTVK